MTVNTNDKELLRRFLLRDVSERERDEIEGRYFGDDAFLDRLLVAEEELIDDYVRDQLPAGERAKFERQYTANAVNRQEVEFSRTLQRAVDDARPPVPRETLWQRLSNFLFPRRLALAAWAGALVLALGVAVTWWQSGRSEVALDDGSTRPPAPSTPESTPVQAERRLEQQGGSGTETTNGPAGGGPEAVRPPGGAPGANSAERPAGTPRPPRRATRERGEELASSSAPTFELSLHTGVTLGSPTNTPPPLRIPRGAKDVRLKIQVVRNEYREYRVSLQTVGAGRAWQTVTPKGHTDATGEWVVVSVPASTFRNKDYILRVAADSPDGGTETLALRQIRVEHQDGPRR